jgi:hypothetical protein
VGGFSDAGYAFYAFTKSSGELVAEFARIPTLVAVSLKSGDFSYGFENCF